MTKKSVSSWFQFDSNVVSAVTYVRKFFFENWLVLLSSRIILCCECALET